MMSEKCSTLSFFVLLEESLALQPPPPLKPRQQQQQYHYSVVCHHHKVALSSTSVLQTLVYRLLTSKKRSTQEETKVFFYCLTLGYTRIFEKNLKIKTNKRHDYSLLLQLIFRQKYLGRFFTILNWWCLSSFPIEFPGWQNSHYLFFGRNQPPSTPGRLNSSKNFKSIISVEFSFPQMLMKIVPFTNSSR